MAKAKGFEPETYSMAVQRLNHLGHSVAIEKSAREECVAGTQFALLCIHRGRHDMY